MAERPALRAATPGDVAPLADLWVQSAAAAFVPLLPEDFELPPRNILEARLRAGLAQQREVAIAIAEAEGKTVGYVAAGPSRDPDVLEATGEIWSIFLHPDAWGRGIGRLLMGAALEHLAGFGEVTVWSFRGNERANSFYERHGFRRDGAEKRMAEWAQVPIVRYRLRR